MGISKEDVEYIANLSRLEVTDSETKEYAKQLSDILAHVERLKKLNKRYAGRQE